MKKGIIAFLCSFLAGMFVCWWLVHSTAHAQTTATPYQFSVNPNSTVANCAVVPAQTTFCYVGNGIQYVSTNGGAFAGPPPVPTKAVIPAQTIPAQTVPLQ